MERSSAARVDPSPSLPRTWTRVNSEAMSLGNVQPQSSPFLAPRVIELPALIGGYPSCMRTRPIAKEDASVCTSNGLL